MGRINNKHKRDMNSKEQKEWDEFNIKIMAFLMFGFGFVLGIVFSYLMLK